MLHQSLCWWLMFSIWSWLIVPIKNLINCLSIENFGLFSISPLSHFVHQEFKLVLNFLCFLLHLWVLKIMRASFIMVDFFNLINIGRRFRWIYIIFWIHCQNLLTLWSKQVHLSWDNFTLLQRWHFVYSRINVKLSGRNSVEFTFKSSNLSVTLLLWILDVRKFTVFASLFSLFLGWFWHFSIDLLVVWWHFSNILNVMKLFQFLWTCTSLCHSSHSLDVFFMFNFLIEDLMRNRFSKRSVEILNLRLSKFILISHSLISGALSEIALFITCW